MVRVKHERKPLCPRSIVAIALPWYERNFSNKVKVAGATPVEGFKHQEFYKLPLFRELSNFYILILTEISVRGVCVNEKFYRI